jgi:hypothetical protein
MSFPPLESCPVRRTRAEENLVIRGSINLASFGPGDKIVSLGSVLGIFDHATRRINRNKWRLAVEQDQQAH